jgi:hypothetical protein
MMVLALELNKHSHHQWPLVLKDPSIAISHNSEIKSRSAKSIFHRSVKVSTRSKQNRANPLVPPCLVSNAGLLEPANESRHHTVDCMHPERPFTPQ